MTGCHLLSLHNPELPTLDLAYFVGQLSKIAMFDVARRDTKTF